MNFPKVILLKLPCFEGQSSENSRHCLLLRRAYSYRAISHSSLLQDGDRLPLGIQSPGRVPKRRCAFLSEKKVRFTPRKAQLRNVGPEGTWGENSSVMGGLLPT